MSTRPTFELAESIEEVMKARGYENSWRRYEIEAFAKEIGLEDDAVSRDSTHSRQGRSSEEEGAREHQRLDIQVGEVEVRRR
ncbi:MAG: hypothetical protein ABIE94_00335 [archaeon]